MSMGLNFTTILLVGLTVVGNRVTTAQEIPTLFYSEVNYFASHDGADRVAGQPFRLVTFQDNEDLHDQAIEPVAQFGGEGTYLDGADNSLATLAQLEQTALALNPSVMEARAKIDSLRGKLTQAGLPPNPTVGIIGDDINEEGSGGRYGVFFGREIVRGNKLGLSQSVVCAEIQTAEQQLAVVEQKLLTDVRRRYYELLVAQEKVTVSEELVSISQNVTDVSNKLLEAKEVAKSAILQSRLELQNAVVVKRQAENQQLAARRKLAALLGNDQLAYQLVTGNVRELPELNEFQSAFDQLAHASPEISALFAEVEQARRQLARAKAEPIPNMTWQSSLQYGTGSDDVVAAFQVGMPIPRLNRNQGAIYQAQQEITVAERKAEKRLLDLRQRLATAYESYLNAKLQIDAYDAEILPTAKESFQLISEGYQQGEVDFLQLLTAQRTYSQTVLQYLDKLQQAWQQSVQIQGLLLSGSLE